MEKTEKRFTIMINCVQVLSEKKSSVLNKSSRDVFGLTWIGLQVLWCFRDDFYHSFICHIYFLQKHRGEITAQRTPIHTHNTTSKTQQPTQNIWNQSLVLEQS